MGPLAMYASQRCKMYPQNPVKAACQLNFLKVNFLGTLCLILIIIYCPFGIGFCGLNVAFTTFIQDVVMAKGIT